MVNDQRCPWPPATPEKSQVPYQPFKIVPTSIYIKIKIAGYSKSERQYSQFYHSMGTVKRFYTLR